MLFFYEVTELFPHPSNVVDISEVFKLKIEAIKQYKSQASVLPNIIEYVEGLAKVRGFLIGVRYAEAFLDSHLWPTRGLGIPGLDVVKMVEHVEETG